MSPSSSHADINAQAAQADPDSVFHYYRQLIALRKQLPVLVHGRFEAWTPNDPQIVGYLRHWGELSLFVICNMGKNLRHLMLPEQLAARAGQCVLSNLPVTDQAWQRQVSLRAFEAHMWLLR